MLTEHLNARINPGVSKTLGGGRGRVRVRVKLGLGLVSALTLKQHSLKKKDRPWLRRRPRVLLTPRRGVSKTPSGAV